MLQEKGVLWQTLLELALFLVNILASCHLLWLQVTCTSTPIMQLLNLIVLYLGAMREHVRKFALLEL